MSHYYSSAGKLVDPWTPGAYPSPSTILDMIADPSLETAMQRLGENAEQHIRAAADRGTRVHKACELWLSNGYDAVEAAKQANLTIEDMDYLVGFVTWWAKFTPRLVATEMFVSHETLKYRGRFDLLVRLDRVLWLIDIKTGMTKARHGLQVKFYSEAYRDMVKRSGEVVEPVHQACLYLDPRRACGYRGSKLPYGLTEYREPLSAIKAHIMAFRWWSKKQPIKPNTGGTVWEG